MNSSTYLALAERDANIADALASILHAMRMVNGCKIEMAGTPGTLQLDDQMLKAHEALLLLGVDSNELQ